MIEEPDDLMAVWLAAKADCEAIIRQIRTELDRKNVLLSDAFARIIHMHTNSVTREEVAEALRPYLSRSKANAEYATDAVMRLLKEKDLVG